MKHLKTFEAKQSIKDIKYKIRDFLIKFEDAVNRNYLTPMHYYEIPKEFEYEFLILQFLYSDTHNRYAPNWKTNWKQGDNTDKYIKRQVKNYVQQLILEKFNNDPSLYQKLRKIINDKHGMPRNAADRYLLFNFITAVKNAPEYVKMIDNYNL